MRLCEGMPVRFGPIKGMVYGGPFRNYVPGTRRLVGVKMAEEIDHPHDISIPTQDFSIPDEADMRAGILAALKALNDGNDLYCGCMGGLGRTGLFMGCMAKVMADWEVATNEDGGLDVILADPVKYVRHHYKGHAIETQEQQSFVRAFKTEEAIEYLGSIITVPLPEEEKTLPQFNPYVWNWLDPVGSFLRFFGLGSK